ncbi:DUF2634 domain-containing protein [Paenibacillus sp. EKM102P]|uniref:DUF2634 domain-containing protein n=1 Tax=unclassified Paenibacillus TaxID=185978 RepID=UPI00142DBB11|nr:MULTISPECIES: DUF2634 domain-containing protein [unclassified Paenibacillus]KAF6618254.1 DUF2634 domain-containing protein [Paenibacillus sp. EKM101P]KAF6624599.1 DUF2634 domain-containing protein [Paenibacillus sp. EKM102P]KAF6635622.1 DUF2634 domain-containing protein [Paenibacillus sp. EKM10P]KAF6648668.1 DUF2634 domain-containing protein [Paenibacillus sp. EKM11P]
MQSFRLTTDGDLEFDSSGNLVMIEGDEELAQCCRIAIGTNAGEWFLNPDIGLAFRLFLGKLASEEEMRNELTRALLQEERIESVDDVTFSVDRAARLLTVTFKATGTNGEIIQQEGVSINAG